MNRQIVVEKALNAYTLSECCAAEEVLSDWMEAHPDDIGLHEIAGMLGIAKSAAQEQNKATLPMFVNRTPSVSIT